MKVEVDVMPWAPVSNKPTVSVDVKQDFNNLRLAFSSLQFRHILLAFIGLQFATFVWHSVVYSFATFFWHS